MWQYGQVESQFLGAEQPHREIIAAFAVQSQVPGAGFGGNAMFFQEAWHGIGVIAVQVQVDR